MRVLLDTCVLSELNREGGSDNVRQAVSTLPDEAIHLSVISLGEIARGVASLDAGTRRRRLLAWLDGLQTRYVDRLLPIDPETSRVRGEMSARARRGGRTVPTADGLIAATALRHGLQIMTRNTADFEPTGALLVAPWQDEVRAGRSRRRHGHPIRRRGFTALAVTAGESTGETGRRSGAPDPGDATSQGVLGRSATTSPHKRWWRRFEV